MRFDSAFNKSLRACICQIVLFIAFTQSLGAYTSTRDKIGQMLLTGFRGTSVEASSQIIKTINELNLGGVILFDIDSPERSFPRNIINPSQTKKLTHDLKALTSPDLFIAIDVEGGLVNRLKAKYGFKSFLSAQELGNENNLESTELTGQEIAKELKKNGINLNFAPVVDVNINKDNPVIGGLGRSFSPEPDKVAAHAKAFIKGHRKFGVLTAIKHFPGHGSSASDTHTGFVDISNSYQSKELIPFKKLIDSGYADMVMTAHVTNTNVDPAVPATLSDRFLTGILRRDLEFKGVIISDDMHMAAIINQFGFEDAIVLAVNAGCDMLIISNNAKTFDALAVNKAFDAIYNAVSAGKISQLRINESYERIMRLKQLMLVPHQK